MAFLMAVCESDLGRSSVLLVWNTEVWPAHIRETVVLYDPGIADDVLIAVSCYVTLCAGAVRL